MDVPRPLAAAALALVFGAAPLSAQDTGMPTAEEYSEWAAAAEAAPLFATNEPLRITLRSDIEWLRDERNDSVEVDGTLLLHSEGGTLELPLEVRARGNFRRSKRNCNFPPLRLDFPRKDVEGTPFEGQDKLKLVTPCHDGRDQYQDYVLKEYLVYKTFEALTPTGFRTRLVEITYEDIEDDYDVRTKYGFLIEDEESMARRNRALFQDVEQFHPARADGEYSAMVAVFQFLIGNTDWSPVFFHNVKLIRSEDGRYLTVPYDFDFSGAVNARYAAPDASLPINRVTQRHFRGFCRDELQMEPIRALFLEKREAIEETVSGFELLDEDRREDLLDFYEDFYEVLLDDRKFEREILRACRNW